MADLIPATAAALAPLSKQAQEVAVSNYLEHARNWLATAVEMTGPEQIATAKAQVATAAEASKQLGLSKEIQLDAQEMVRRAEYALGKAIRKGQAEGTIRPPSKSIGQPSDRHREAMSILPRPVERFLKLNDTLTVDSFSKFKVGVEAGRPIECDIDRIVRMQGLIIARTDDDNAVSAVGALRRVYQRGGAKTMARALRLIRDTYGKPGFSATVIDGFGLLCQRYNGDLDDAVVVAKLQRLNGSLGGLLARAETIRRQTGSPKAHCVAAAVVEVVNAGRGGLKLSSWWRDAA